MPTPPIARRDLDEILEATAPLWQEMRGQRLFVSGGTGFFGCWLVESFLHINRALSLEAGITVLTRSPDAFLHKLPHLRAEAALTLLEGDVRDFHFPAEPHAFVIHAATEASARQQAEQPEEMQSTILAGTKRIIAFASAAGTRKLLFTSSGAVYGPQPPNITHIDENHPTPSDPSNVYAEGKRAAEQMCALTATPALEIKIARCFAFLGPHLPLDTHFAAGNFLADALAARPIRIASDGSSVRSYLYAADLASWLWTMLFRAPALRPFNVGSEEALDIAQLAHTVVSAIAPHIQVEVAQPCDPGRLPHRYVPSTRRAQSELNLHQTVSLEDALQRTAAWHRLK